MANASNSLGLRVDTPSGDPVVRELNELVYRLVAFPDPSKSGPEGARVFVRVNQIIFDEASDAKDRQRRLGILMGLCLAAGHRVTPPNQPKEQS